MSPASVMRSIALISAAASILLFVHTADADTLPTYIVAAVADPSRPDTDRERDANRKPVEVIAFAGMKPGDKVADFMPGRGYFTKIFCKVVGDTGRVYAIAVPFNRPAGSMAKSSAPDKPATAPQGEACTNITASSLGGAASVTNAPAESFAAPEPLDLIWTSENYHDLHNRAFGSPN